jgi:hypothetical protein
LNKNLKYRIENIQISYLVGLPSGSVHFKVVKILNCENPSFVEIDHGYSQTYKGHSRELENVPF